VQDEGGREGEVRGELYEQNDGGGREVVRGLEVVALLESEFWPGAGGGGRGREGGRGWWWWRRRGRRRRGGRRGRSRGGGGGGGGRGGEGEQRRCVKRERKEGGREEKECVVGDFKRRSCACLKSQPPYAFM